MSPSPHDRRTVDLFVERLGGALADAGLNRLASRAFAALVADDDGRMTAAELASALQVSPASVSTAVGYLTRVSFIRRERERGSRRDVYVVDDDAWLNAMLQEDQAYAPMVAALDAGLAALGPDHPAHRRLWLMREFLLFVGAEMVALVDRWEAHRADLERSGPVSRRAPRAPR